MKLELDHYRKPFRPGDIITGRIRLGLQDVCVQKTHLVLEGRAKTKTREKRGESTTYYRARAPLLYEVQDVDLTSGLTGIDEHGRRLVPFQMRIPTEVPNVVNVPTTKDGLFKSYWNYDWGKPKPEFQNQSGHSLPPTFKTGPKGVYTKSECYVEYSITAVGSWIKPQNSDYPGLAQSTLEPCRFDTKSFWMQSACPLTASYRHAPRETRQTASRIHVQSLRLLPAVSAREKPGKLTFKEKLKSITSSNTLPHIVFTAAIKVPTYLIVGEPLPLTLQMKRVDQATATSSKHGRPSVPFPSIQIESIEVKLKPTTNVRTCGTMKMHTDSWTDTAWTDTQNNGLLSTRLPIWEGEAPPSYFNPSHSSSSLSKKASGTSLDHPRPQHQFEHHPSPLRASTTTTSTMSGGVTGTFDLQTRHELPERLIPTFSTFNISRSYDIRVSIALSCAGEKKFVNFNGPVNVYSRPEPSFSSSPSSTRAGASVPAPAYEDAFDSEDQDLAREVLGLSFVGAPGKGGVAGSGYPSTSGSASTGQTMADGEEPVLPERVDSGFGADSGRSDSRQGRGKSRMPREDEEEEEDWGEYKITADDKVECQKMAGIAVGGLVGGS